MVALRLPGTMNVGQFLGLPIPADPRSPLADLVLICNLMLFQEIVHGGTTHGQ